MKRSKALVLDRDLANADWLRGEERTTPETGRFLRMRYAGGIVKHLGLHMYSGAVPAIAELVANAWDADSRKVEIAIPLDKPFASNAVITVADDGSGMSFEEVNALYLLVGRDRRGRTEKSRDGRMVMGHKGIGKLAGFGIAHVIEVWTVDERKWLTAFRLRYDEIVRDTKSSFVETYSPEVLADRPVGDGDPRTTRGTLVRLTELQLKNAINGDLFVDAMARRFAVLSHTFQVRVNGIAIKPASLEFALRVPRSGMKSEDVPGVGRVRWWAGFTEKPIKFEHARGIAVLVRGKMAQEPFFFRLQGGAHAQVGLEYLTGEVHADSLDAARDLIATDRASILWEDPAAEPLRGWGERKVRELLQQWDTSKQKNNEERIPKEHRERIRHFPRRQRTEISSALRRLSAIPTIEVESLTNLSDALIRAYENQQLLDVVRDMADAKQAPAHVVESLAELNVQEAAGLTVLLRARVEALRTLESMTGADSLDWDAVLRMHPWILGVDWGYMTPPSQAVKRTLTESERSVGVRQSPIWFASPRRLSAVWLERSAAPTVSDIGRVIEAVEKRLQRMRVSDVVVVGKTLRSRGWVRELTLPALLAESRREHERALAQFSRASKRDVKVRMRPT